MGRFKDLLAQKEYEDLIAAELIAEEALDYIDWRDTEDV